MAAMCTERRWKPAAGAQGGGRLYHRRQATFFTGGMVHVPSRIDGSVSCGQYIRSIRMNLPAGAGSQLLSFSDPGLSFWMYRSVEPSGFAFRFCLGLIEYRLIGLATKKYWLSYIVSDQNPSAGGVCPFSKRMTYLFDPS